MSNLPDALAELEKSIRAAGGYVVPSDNLRPRVLEAAREQARLQRGWWRMLQMVVVLLVCGVISIPASRHVDQWRSRTSAPSSQEMEERAVKLAEQPGVGHSWAMYEAFQKVKESNSLKMHRR